MHIRLPFLSRSVTFFAWCACIALCQAATPPTSGQLLDLATAEPGTFKTEYGATVAQATASDGQPAMQVTFPASNGYPGLNFPVPGGSWDLSQYSGVEVDLVNLSENRLNIGLRVDNPGNWKNSPWNTQNVWLAAGAKQTLTVTFGQSYGNAGYPLDPAKVIALKLFVAKPKADSKVLITGLRAVGSAPAGASEPQGGSASTATVSSPAASPTSAENLLNLSDTSSYKTENGASVSIADEGGSPVLKMSFPKSGSYPGVDMKPMGGKWDLSAFSGVQAEVVNTTSTSLGVGLRVDNPGNWKKSPWNSQTSWIGAGKSGTVTVTFGESYGQPAYNLDAGNVANIKMLVDKPKAEGALLIKSIKPVGTASPKAAQEASTPAPASSDSASTNFNSPAISGELFNLAEGASVNQLKTYHSTVSVVGSGKEQAIRAVLEKTNYPNVQFPCPKGGWNLEHFQGIEVEVTNESTHRIQAALRVDNPGNWKNEPWNTEVQKLQPGETKNIQLTFGQSNGAPGFPLDSRKVTGVQLFLVHPKAETTLLIKDLKAFGSSDQGENKNVFSSIADRDTPVTPPDWLGERPPVEGDWVMTLDEQFDGDQLDLETWNTRYVWDGPADWALERFTKKNISVEDGNLTIKCEVNPGHQYDDPNLPTRKYATAALTTYDKWTQRYGYIEARLKPPTARGLWPAFWLMPDRGAESGLDVWQRRSTGSKNGQGMEIDIFEHLTEWGPGRNNIAAHWGGYGANHKQWGTNQVYYGPTSDGWHVFGLLWEPGKLTWYVDGVKKGVWENEEVGNVPGYVILCVQMGGWSTKDIDEASLPDYFQIDYVRAWQLAERMDTLADNTAEGSS